MISCSSVLDDETDLVPWDIFRYQRLVVSVPVVRGKFVAETAIGFPGDLAGAVGEADGRAWRALAVAEEMAVAIRVRCCQGGLAELTQDRIRSLFRPRLGFGGGGGEADVDGEPKRARVFSRKDGK